MCAECRTSPCAPSCPNAPPKIVVGECSICGMDIEVGDKYYEFQGEWKICTDCSETASIRELTEITYGTSKAAMDSLGFEFKEARSE